MNIKRCLDKIASLANYIENWQHKDGMAVLEETATEIAELSAIVKRRISWYDYEDWHEDHGTCVFIFMTNDNDYHSMYETSPLCSDFPDLEKEGLWCKYIRVDTDFDLPERK